MTEQQSAARQMDESDKRQTKDREGGSGASPVAAFSDWALGGVNGAAADADAELNWRTMDATTTVHLPPFQSPSHLPSPPLKYLSHSPIDPPGKVPFAVAAGRLGGWWLLTSMGQGAATPTGGPRRGRLLGRRRRRGSSP